jgi:hypothetical protein
MIAFSSTLKNEVDPSQPSRDSHLNNLTASCLTQEKIKKIEKRNPAGFTSFFNIITVIADNGLAICSVEFRTIFFQFITNYV